MDSNLKAVDWQEYYRDLLEGESQGGGCGSNVDKAGDFKDSIQEIEIFYAIRELKKKKAVGVDGIPNKAWIYAIDDLVKVLSKLLRKVQEGQDLPEN